MTNTILDRTAAPISERRFVQIIIATVVVGFLALAVVVGMTGWLLARAQEFDQQIRHTYTVEARISEFRALFERAEAARRGYLISGDARYTGTYDAVAPRLQPLVSEMRSLTLDNPVQTDRLDRLQPLLSEKLDLFEQTMALRRNGDLMGSINAFNAEREQTLLDEIRALTAAMAATEQVLLAPRTGSQTENVRALLLGVSLAGALLAVLAFVSLWVMRRFARDLARSETKLRRLNEDLEGAVRERTADLTRANEEIQRFAYIVSHDLRSPLVNIMGFTSELEVAAKPLRMLIEEVDAVAPDAISAEARAVVESELPEAVEFIRSSTQKMDRLINAILKLSREGRRNLNPEPLQMNSLVDGVIASLRHLIDDKGADVAVEGDLPDIRGDRVAVEQIFSNLIENALKYLKAGRPGRVRIRGRVEVSGVVYEVEDNGRGVATKDQERIFELFRRAGAQDQSGEGIGLAHVRALAYRLGGLVDCVSDLDQGATFRLSLPRILTLQAENRQ